MGPKYSYSILAPNFFSFFLIFHGNFCIVFFAAWWKYCTKITLFERKKLFSWHFTFLNCFYPSTVSILCVNLPLRFRIVGGGQKACSPGTERIKKFSGLVWPLHCRSPCSCVSVLKKKRIHNPSLQYRKAKEPAVKLNGLTKQVLTWRYWDPRTFVYSTKLIRN